MPKQKKKVEIYKILSITSVGKHAWVETNVGRIKKELNKISQELIDVFRKEAHGNT